MRWAERLITYRVGVCRPVLKTLTLFQTKNTIFHTLFQTNVQNGIPYFRPASHMIHWRLTIKCRYHAVHYHRHCSKLNTFFCFPTRFMQTVFFSLIALLYCGDKTSCYEIIPYSRPKRQNRYPIAQTKNAVEHDTLWGGTYLYGHFRYMGVKTKIPPPGQWSMGWTERVITYRPNADIEAICILQNSFKKAVNL